MPLLRLNSNEGRIIGLARWGLIPSWAKDSPKTKPINARAETIATRGMFKQAFAGIWERWTQEGTAKSIDTFAIVTTGVEVLQVQRLEIVPRCVRRAYASSQKVISRPRLE